MPESGKRRAEAVSLFKNDRAIHPHVRGLAKSLNTSYKADKTIYRDTSKG
ncbi:hypothetical protein IMCC14465_02460 [alpha proteobacterium IMCC14465]|uniref:Uncharacterized protein n=1 Tax=alpha proteobacterium IMCC14465 TaxID=1220535 RepID=J9DXS9_9PROT|nr:hypothetical protein IMCC14465_02460 [alpha proteobacterium IMCC14465]